MKSAYVGSELKIISSQEQEIIHHTSLYSFRFMNDEDCSVRINGSNPIFIPSKIGFSSGLGESIYSFVVVEPDIHFTWLGKQF